MTRLVDGRYELIEVIGSGGMATVWRARDIKLERMVALKRPHPVPVGDPRHDRLTREAQLSASINHPHLVTVHDAGSDAEGLYLVMELVNAPSLADVKGSLTREQIIDVGAQIGRALTAVHRAGIVHRDVKPANILLANGGAKLTDFGIATNGAGFGAHQPTTPGYFLTTANYAAPEVLAGQQASPKSDVFALGVVLYEHLTGQLPFNGADRSQRPVMIDDPVGPVIDRCLSPYPGERPDGEELAGLLVAAVSPRAAATAAGSAASPGYDPTATTVMQPMSPMGAESSTVTRPPTNTMVDPRVTAGTGSPPGGRRSPDPSAIALAVLGLGALLVVFILIRGAVDRDSDSNLTATEDIEDPVDETAEADDVDPNSSVTVPSGESNGGDTESAGDGDGAESESGEDGDGEGDDDDGGGFGLGGGIIDRIRGVDDMIDSVNDQIDSVSEQIEDLDAKAKDVRDIMKRINDAVELAGEAKPEEAAEKLEEAARKADDNLDGEARDQVFNLIEDVAEQLGVEDLDLDQFRDDD